MPVRAFLRRVLTLAAGVACLAPAVSLASAAPASADYSSGPAFGVQFHGMWSEYSDAQRQATLDKLKAAGVQWVRLDLGWAMLQPSGPGVYDLGWGVPFTDTVINEIHSRGFHLLVTFWRTPSWANAGAGETTLPTHPSDYAAAIQWAAARYAGVVNAWEVWNEPNMGYSMTGADPVQYAALLRAAYPAVHAGDPNALVVFGGPSENDAPWIAKAYAAGIQGSFDVMATHPYMGPSDAAPATPDDGTIYKLTHVAAVHALMTQYGDGAKPIWFTEFGWSSHVNTAGMQNWELGVSLQTQADYLVQTLQLLKASYPYVTNAFWYEASDQNTGTTSNNDNYGLLTTSLATKPAYDAVASYLASLGTTTTTSGGTTSGGTTSGGTTSGGGSHVSAHGPKKTSYLAPATFTAEVSTSTGVGVPYAPVVVSTRVGTGAWQPLTTLLSNAAGGVSLTLHPLRTTTVRFTYQPPTTSTPVVATQADVVSSSVTIGETASTVRAGRTVRIAGHVTPRLAGFVVRREVYSGGRWRVVATTRTGRGGYYVFRVATARARVLHFRVLVASRGPLGGSVSAALRLAVV